MAAATTPTTADGKTVVTFWQHQFEDYQQAWFKKQVDAFNAVQDKVKVKVQVVPGDAWAQKLKAAQAAGKAPDVATTNYGAIPPGVADGKFAKLDDADAGRVVRGHQGERQDFVTIEGKHYGVPDAGRAVDRAVLPHRPGQGGRPRPGAARRSRGPS